MYCSVKSSCYNSCANWPEKEIYNFGLSAHLRGNNLDTTPHRSSRPLISSSLCARQLYQRGTICWHCAFVRPKNKMSYKLNVYNTQENKTCICLKTIDLETSMKLLDIKLSSCFICYFRYFCDFLQVGQERNICRFTIRCRPHTLHIFREEKPFC